jgi:hypothetical protein
LVVKPLQQFPLDGIDLIYTEESHRCATSVGDLMTVVNIVNDTATCLNLQYDSDSDEDNENRWELFDLPRFSMSACFIFWEVITLIIYHRVI